MRDDTITLGLIVDYADEIAAARSRFGDDVEDYLSDPFYKAGCTHFILQIGECVNRLSDGFKDAHPEIPWSGIVAVRNLVAHRYTGLSDERIWRTIVEEVPELRDYCARELDVLKRRSAEEGNTVKE